MCTPFLSWPISQQRPGTLPIAAQPSRHVEMRAGAARDRVGDRVHHRGDRGRGAGFADALDAERIGGRRHIEHGVAQRRHVVGARHGVVHERAGDELAVAVVVDDVLHQRLAEPCRERAVQLALDDHVVEHVAAIVDRRVGDDRPCAPVSGSISTSAMCTPFGKGQRRLGRGLGVEVFGDLAALLHLGGARGDLEQRRRAGRCRPPRSGRLDRRCRPSPASSMAARDGLALRQHRVDRL